MAPSLFAIAIFAAPPIADDGFIAELLARQPEKFGAVAKAPERFRAQILVSEVRQANGKPSLVRHGWRVDAEYFYPASAMKTVAAIAALEKLAELHEKNSWVSLDTPLFYHPLFEGQTLEDKDGSNDGGKITLRHEIRKMSVVSDNRSFNRLYEFVGHRELNEAIRSWGLGATNVFHRLSQVRTTEENRKTPRIELRMGRHKLEIPERESDLVLKNPELPGLDAGDRYLLDGEIIEAPFSFREKNRMSLVDLQNMLVSVIRPEIDLGIPGVRLSEADRKLLIGVMEEQPVLSTNSIWPTEKYDPRRFKPVLPGLARIDDSPKRWRVFNKAGKAYGFRIENAYVVDTKTKRSFFFTVALYVNENRVMNDGQYQYDEVADPFIHDLCEAVVVRLGRSDTE